MKNQDLQMLSSSPGWTRRLNKKVCLATLVGSSMLCINSYGLRADGNNKNPVNTSNLVTHESWHSYLMLTTIAIGILSSILWLLLLKRRKESNARSIQDHTSNAQVINTSSQKNLVTLLEEFIEVTSLNVVMPNKIRARIEHSLERSAKNKYNANVEEITALSKDNSNSRNDVLYETFSLPETTLHVIFMDLSEKAQKLLLLLSWIGEDIPSTVLEGNPPWNINILTPQEVEDVMNQIAVVGFIEQQMSSGAQLRCTLSARIREVLQTWQTSGRQINHYGLALEWIYSTFDSALAVKGKLNQLNDLSQLLTSLISHSGLSDDPLIKPRARSLLVHFFFDTKQFAKADEHVNELKDYLRQDLENADLLFRLEIASCCSRSSAIKYHLSDTEQSQSLLAKAWQIYLGVLKELPLGSQVLKTELTFVHEFAKKTGNRDIFDSCSILIADSLNSQGRHAEVLKFAESCDTLNENIGLLTELGIASDSLGLVDSAASILEDLHARLLSDNVFPFTYKSKLFEALGKHRLERKKNNLYGFELLYSSLNAALADNPINHAQIARVKTFIARYAITFLNEKTNIRPKTFRRNYTPKTLPSKFQRQYLYHEAISKLKEAFEYSKSTADHLAIAFVLNTLCWQCTKQDKLDLIRSCLSLVRDLGDLHAECTILHQLGKHIPSEYSYEDCPPHILCQARECFLESIQIKESLNVSSVTSLHQLAKVELRIAADQNRGFMSSIYYATKALEGNYQRDNMLMKVNWDLVKKIFYAWRQSVYVVEDKDSVYSGIKAFKTVLYLSTKDTENGHGINDYRYGRMVGYWGLAALYGLHLKDMQKADDYINKALIIATELRIQGKPTADIPKLEQLRVSLLAN